MKKVNYILPILIFVISVYCPVNIYSFNEIESKQICDTIYIESIDTTFNVKLPVLKLGNQKFWRKLTTIVFKYEIDKMKEYSDCFYTLGSVKDSLNRGYYVYVDIVPLRNLNHKEIKGVIRVRNKFIICFSDNFDNIYKMSNETQEFEFNKRVAYIHDKKRVNDSSPRYREGPTWKFTYENKKLKFYRVDFLPEKDNKID